MNTQTAEQVLLDELLPIVATVQALTPVEARQAHVRLLADHKSRPEGAPLTVEELAVADLDRMLCERIAQG